MRSRRPCSRRNPELKRTPLSTRDVTRRPTRCEDEQAVPRSPARAALLLAVAWLGLACAEAGSPDSRTVLPATDSPVEVVDASGRSLRFTAPPRRIVSLVPAVTTMLLALEARGGLAGRTDFDTSAAVRDLPSVGDGLRPDLEQLLMLEPDLVIRFEGQQDAITGPALDARGIAHLGVRTDRITDVREILLQLGQVMRREPMARVLVDELDRELAEVRGKVAGRQAVSAAYLLGGDPPWVAGAGTYLGDLLEIAGAENVFADMDRLYAPISLETLLIRDPDILVVAEGTPVDEQLRARTPVHEVSASIESPGIGLGDSARELAEAIHPEAFR